MHNPDPADLEAVLIHDGWAVAVHAYSDPAPDLSDTRSYLASLTAPTGARFDANGWSRSTALRSAALLAGLIEPDDAKHG